MTSLLMNKTGDSNNSDLDFQAVQRGDPEMEQKLNRVIRACIESSSSQFCLFVIVF
jgi:phosphoribosylformylglycinamidine (FGAM) synthase-like enzyme